MELPSWVLGRNPRAVLKRMLTSVLLILSLAWLAHMAMVGFGQHGMVYFPDRILTETPAGHGLPYEDVWLQSGDDTLLHGWFVPAGNQAKTAVLFLHGNAGNISSFIPFLHVFHRLGLPVLTVDYRGYGQSQGEPDEEGLYADALAAWRHLTGNRGYSPDRIIVVGYSLGGAVGSSLLRHTPQPLTLVILSSFTSVYDMAKWQFPWLPVSWIQRIYFPADEFLGDYTGHLLAMHGVDDAVIPITLGRKLFDHVSSTRKEFVELPGGHNTYIDDPARFSYHLRAYLQRFPPVTLEEGIHFDPAGD